MTVRPLLFFLALPACAGGAPAADLPVESDADADTDADADADADSDADAETPATGETGVPGIPDFQADVVPIFERTCGATDNGCHSAVAYHANVGADCKGWLSLENRPLGSTMLVWNDEDQVWDEVETGCPDRKSVV